MRSCALPAASVGTLFDPPAERLDIAPASCGLRWATKATAR